MTHVFSKCVHGLLQPSKKSMSDLENGMITIIRVFHKYTANKCKLKKAELKSLIDNEMSHFIMVSYGERACFYPLLGNELAKCLFII